MEFLEQKIIAERDRSEREIQKNKAEMEDEIEKQRIEYEKYMVDIRYINEQNKLRHLEQIEELQKELQKYQEFESSDIQSEDMSKSTTEKVLLSISHLNKKISELQNQEPVYIWVNSEGELQQFKSPNSKVNKKNKFKPVLNRDPSISSFRTGTNSWSTKTVSSSIVGATKTHKSVNPESSKLQSLIKKLKEDLKQRDTQIITLTKEKQKFEEESKHMQGKLIEITSSHKKVISDLKRKLKQNEKRNLKPSIYVNTSKYSRNRSNRTNFSIYTHSYKTVSNVSNPVLDVKNTSVSKELSKDNICSTWKAKESEFDIHQLVQHKDLIQQIQCKGCSIYMPVSKFIQHADCCREENFLKQEMDTSKLCTKGFLQKEDDKIISESGLETEENMASMFRTRATGRIIEEGRDQASNYSPENQQKTQASPWVRRSNSLKTSVQSTENLSKILRKGKKSLFDKAVTQKTIPAVADGPTSKIFELEDEDIVNRDDSFITDEFMKVANRSSSKDSEMSKFLENNYITESPDLTKSKLMKNYFTNSSSNLMNHQAQPMGDRDDEIVLGFKDSQGSDSF